MYATGQSMLTKQGNGTISNISLGTGVKSAVGSQAVDLYRTVIGFTHSNSWPALTKFYSI